MKNIKIRKDGIEFLIVNDIMDNDGWRYLFCRKTPKNRFIGHFTPWRMMKQAYGNSAGYMEYFNFDDVKKILHGKISWSGRPSRKQGTRRTGTGTMKGGIV